jgi:hypothetical protein
MLAKYNQTRLGNTAAAANNHAVESRLQAVEAHLFAQDQAAAAAGSVSFTVRPEPGSRDQGPPHEPRSLRFQLLRGKDGWAKLAHNL